MSIGIGGSASIKLPITCIRGQFGPPLQFFQTISPPSQVHTILGHDPRSSNWKHLPAQLREAYEAYQRKTRQARSDNCANYIRSRLAPHSRVVGAFPALSIGLTEVPRFDELRDRPGIQIDPHLDLGATVGTLYLDIGAAHLRMLLDGIARDTGAMELLNKGLDVDEWFQFALTIYAPTEARGRLTPAELGQLFFDFNYKMTRVPPSLALEMDQAGIYSRMTSYVKDLPVILDNGGMQQSGASLGTKSTALVVRRVLHGFVSTAAEGERALRGSKTEDIRNARTTEENLEDTQEQIGEFLTVFAAAMGSRFTDPDSLHLSRLGWEAVGVIAHEALFKHNLDRDGVESVAKRLAAVDWSRTNPDWLGMIGEAERDHDGNVKVDSDGKKRVVISGGKGDMGLKRMINYLRRKVWSSKAAQQADADLEDAPA
jgi:hypothetical protein